MTAAPDPLRCRDCGTTGLLLLDSLCVGGRDHFIGAGGCRWCGRLVEVCKQSPCQVRRRPLWRRWLRGGSR